MAASLPPLPVSLKPIQHYLKTAVEHDKRDPAVAYYCRLYALQRGMELDKSSPEGRTFLLSLMDLAEKTKKEMSDNEAIKSEVVGQAHVEDYALKLFLYADNEDRAARFGKNVVKSFYTAGMLFDVLTQFGEPSEDIEANRKYAKWKAAYIHNCLKNGETPHPGPLDDDENVPNPGEADGVPPNIGFPEPGAPMPPSHPSISASQHTLPPTQPTLPPSQPVIPPIQPVIPPTQPAVSQPNSNQVSQTWIPPANPAGVTLTAQEYQKAIKLCKYSISALQYEDPSTAVDNLAKALKLLTTGQE
ncbi:hypothetical protein LSH36_260g01083 [Paralvinella palmiformis]|uniref:Vacuolar protein sorting-associated protein VTA1 homolog n=1 Tax=Paralvinella palmiformis TaxID=53620 RepID=A0AAD9JL63_9ANNE|nr:hypothetical protein LSH36_260g01083 [Paralvinella palmiformis]